MIRNATYTIYNGYDLRFTQNTDGTFHLISSNGIKPDSDFKLYSKSEGIYTKDVDAKEITNAYMVETFAIYAGLEWQVDKLVEGKIRLTRSEETILPNVKMVDRDWFEVWIPVEIASRVWEKRRPTGYQLPYPSSVAFEFELFS
jgi:hypothetical protein